MILLVLKVDNALIDLSRKPNFKKFTHASLNEYYLRKKKENEMKNKVVKMKQNNENQSEKNDHDENDHDEEFEMNDLSDKSVSNSNHSCLTSDVSIQSRYKLMTTLEIVTKRNAKLTF